MVGELSMKKSKKIFIIAAVACIRGDRPLENGMNLRISYQGWWEQ